MTHQLPLLVLALVACGGGTPAATTPPLPRPADASVDARTIDAPEVAVDDDVHHHGDGHHHDDDELACEDVIRDLATFPPALPDDAPERDWNLAIRAHVLEEDCEHLWTFEHKTCLASKGAAGCAAQLPGELVDRLTKLSELGAKIGAARAKPATIGCKQVVAAHYGNVRWQGRLDGFAAQARTQMIADSRTLMQKACRAEKWSDSTRACLVLGGANLCFFGTRIRRMWGFPADGSVRSLGIPDCDAYDEAVTKLANCKNVETYARESLLRTAAALKATIASVSAVERAKRAQSCRVALAPILELAATSGC